MSDTQNYEDEIDNLKLIRAVQENEIVFNKRHADFKKLSSKEIAWQYIARECEASVEVTKRRWRGLRDRFVRELRTMNEKSSEGPQAQQSQWGLFAKMTFVKEFVTPRGRTSGPRMKGELDDSTFTHSLQDAEIIDRTDFDSENTLADDYDPLSEFIVLKGNTSTEEIVINTKGFRGFEDVDLINVVKGRELLYQRQHPDYRNVGKKNTAWNDVAAICGATVQMVRNRWKQLRDRFAREAKLGEQSTWPLSNYMSFLQCNGNSLGHSTTTYGATLHSDDDEDIATSASVPAESEYESNVSSKLAEADQGTDDTIEDAKLIELVRQNPILFDRNHFFYNNVIRKEMAWKAISMECLSTVVQIKNRWKYLRDKFVREIKMQKDSLEQSQWPHFQNLLFLAKHVRPRFKDRTSRDILVATDSAIRTEAHSPVMSVKCETPERININEDDHTISYEEYEPMAKIKKYTNPVTSPAVALRKSKDSTIEDNINSQILVALNHLQCDDEDDYFGKFIAEKLKKFPKKMRNEAKAHIFDYLTELDNILGE